MLIQEKFVCYEVQSIIRQWYRVCARQVFGGIVTRIFDKKNRNSVSENTNHAPRFNISVMLRSLIKTGC
jgi:hypothetical protein